MKMFDTEAFSFMSNPLTEYLVDAGQRSILYWDVMRQRGNQYKEHMAKEAPHVLQFDSELVMDGRELPEPVNYGLVMISPIEGVAINPRKRPFVVVDPRAGHGPGIGGFKADSEIGAARTAGHPCYFIGFLPMPEEGQTIEKVMKAEVAFLKRVIERHPESDGKPALFGNCQAGWAVMMLAATHPELCGPIIAAGSPLSYWAGVRGKNPMRYSGGLLGGSWLTAMTSDLGNGKFDGAWLVSNMEDLNPANTHFTKKYNLYKDIDTEGSRFLEFERWWGGHVVLNGEEMQYIVDNLFVGNKLPSAEVITEDGMQIDFRKIQSPIVCFCSEGDNITPPQQALGWILDLYESVDDIRAAGQTIVYSIHDSVGHLGIFVSGSVAKKEHTEFTENIDLIDYLPPGLYEAVFEENTTDIENSELVSNDHLTRFEVRTVDDIRALGVNTVEDERCFATVARLSEVTNGLYRKIAQPLVQAMATEESAEMMRKAHPLRREYEMMSDENPLMKQLDSAAQAVKENRKPVADDNIFLQWQNSFAELTKKSLDSYRDFRDMKGEKMFFDIYSQPLLQILLGMNATDEHPRPRPGQDPAHKAHVDQRIKELTADIEKGGLAEALVRSTMYIRAPSKAFDERGFVVMQQIRKEYAPNVPLEDFKFRVREQFFMLLLDETRAIAAIPTLLKGHEKDAPKVLELIRKIVAAAGKLSSESENRLSEITKFFSGEDRKPGVKAAPKTKATKNLKKKG